MAILSPTTEEAMKATIDVARVKESNPTLYNRAYALQKELGLGGMWRGTDTTCWLIIEALRYERDVMSEEIRLKQ